MTSGEENSYGDWSDDQLLEAFRGGDRGAVAELYARCNSRVRLWLASRWCGTASDLDDLCQLAWSRAWEAHETFEPRGISRFRSWLMTVAERARIDSLRKNSPQTGQEGFDPVAEVVDDNSDELQALRECVAELPETQRVVLQALLSGVSVEEVAKSEEISSQAVYKRKHDAKAQLQSCVEGKLR